MRPIKTTVLFDDAVRLIMDAATPIERIDRVPLLDADGRVAAHDVISSVDVPPFDRAAMDGYAVVAEDTFGSSPQSPQTLRCVDRVFTSQVPMRRVERGLCIEIATGAPMPDGADAVVMVEETERETTGAGDAVRILSPVYPRQNVGRRGADLTTGQTVVARGQVLSPSQIGALAAIGVTGVDVYARPAVAILSTGNEIAEPGQPLAPGQIYDINRFTLEAVIRRHGGVAIALGTVGDSLPELFAALDHALGVREPARASDLIVFSGGSSVGERDLVLDVLQQRGEIFFHGVAVKPGKPTA